MISLILIFGFLCRSCIFHLILIPRWPRNIVQQCARFVTANGVYLHTCPPRLLTQLRIWTMKCQFSPWKVVFPQESCSAPFQGEQSLSSSSSSVTSFKSLYKHHSLIHWLPSLPGHLVLHKFYWSMLVFSYERFIWKGKSWFLRITSGGDQSSGEELATRKSGDIAWVACFLSMWFIKCLPYFTYPFRIVPKRGVFQLHNLSSWWWSW